MVVGARKSSQMETIVVSDTKQGVSTGQQGGRGSVLITTYTLGAANFVIHMTASATNFGTLAVSP